MSDVELEAVDPWVASMKLELSARMRWVRETFKERRKMFCPECSEIRTCFVLKTGRVLCPRCHNSDYEQGASALATYEVQNWSRKMQEIKARHEQQKKQPNELCPC